MKNGSFQTVSHSPASADGANGDPFDTALIARLFDEVAAELQHGLPAAALPIVGGSDKTLPLDHESHSPAPPPVHPILSDSARSPAVSEPSPSSTHVRTGGHQAGAEDTHDFGEPRCSRERFGTELSSKPDVRSGHSLTHLAEPTGAGDASSFYFLREPERTQAPTGHASFAESGNHPPLRGFDVHAVRADFPALRQKVYGRDLIWFDNAATTHKPQSVIDAVSHFYAHDYSNVNRAAHALAQRATELYENGREKVREFIGAASKDEIVFVRGTTEAINLVAQTFGKQNIGSGDEILLTTMEHHANIVPWKLLAEQTGANLRVAPINDRGELLLDQFATLFSSRTKLVAITHVSNALGTINPVEHIIALAHAYGVPVLVDGAQSTPHLPVNVQALGADFYVFSGHKIFAPTGIGILYGRKELLDAMPPYQGGGSMINDVTFSKITYNPAPQKFEAGTQHIAGVVGLAAAINYLLGIGMPAIAAYEHELLEYATAALADLRGIRPIGTAAAKASVLTFVVDGVDSEEVGRFLDSQGIAVRAGHHCAQPSLRRFGVEKAVRPSFAFYNTREEIDALIRALHQLPRR